MKRKSKILAALKEFIDFDETMKSAQKSHREINDVLKDREKKRIRKYPKLGIFYNTKRKRKRFK